MDKLTSIKAFTKVVQHGSFAAAARELRLSRSAVSKYVIELEQELGVQLLAPHDPQRKPDRERPSLLRALPRHPCRPRGGGPRRQSPASRAARAAARQRPHVVRDDASRFGTRRLHGEISRGAVSGRAERRTARSRARRLRRYAANCRSAVIEPHRAQDRARPIASFVPRRPTSIAAARRTIPMTCVATTASTTDISRPAINGS